MNNLSRFSKNTQELIKHGESLPGVKEVRAYTKDEFLNLRGDQLSTAPAAVRRMWMSLKNKSL